ncbi:MAG: DUF4403 family protein [Niabella sp.]
MKFFLPVLFFICVKTYAQQASPALQVSLPDIPESEIDLPIHINLKPFYALADNKVDTLFTSPGYPGGWAYSGCEVRYKYSFRRGPLQFSLNGTTLVISFTGYYKITGATRLCARGAALSPWTPECKCGFDEGERSVNISYSVQITLLKNYQVLMRVTRNEPQPLDKCTVCFWGQDITYTVMESLKTELDASKKDMEQRYGLIDLKPQFQKLWSLLNTPYNLNNMGWLQINPQAIRINRFQSANDQLNIHIGLSAKPVVSFSKMQAAGGAIPNISNYSRARGFNIFIDGLLTYDSLSTLLSRQIKGKTFDFKKGFIKKKFVFEACRILGTERGRLRMEIKFSGTDNGFFYVTGAPGYSDSTHFFSFSNVEFDIQSQDALLKIADWMFSKKITAEIEEKARYDLTGYVNLAKINIQKQLNREFVKGVSGTGTIHNITISAISPLPGHLLLRMNGSGTFEVQVTAASFNL